MHSRKRPGLFKLIPCHSLLLHALWKLPLIDSLWSLACPSSGSASGRSCTVFD